MDENNENKTKTRITYLQHIKGLLNNLVLLKWVRKYSADKLLEDCKLVEQFGVTTTENSISIADNALTKVIATNSEFKGKEIVRYSAKNLKEVFDLVGATGDIIVSDDTNKNLIWQINDCVIVICPTIRGD